MGCYSSIALVLILAVTAEAAGRGGRVQYVGGTVTEIGTGSRGLLQMTDEEYLTLVTRSSTLRVDYTRVNLLEYGQNVSRRYVMAIVLSPVLILAKKRRHFLTVGYADDEGKQQALVFVVDKNDIRLVLASLEARTGVKVDFQDEEARRAGKG